MTPLARATTCILVTLWLAGCASTSGGPPIQTDIDLSSIPPAVPHPEPLSDTGNPESYTVFGQTYHPISEAAAQDFTQTGMASWYGREFHGERTSSGEPYNMYRMTAAHKTLPLPCYVRVTNLRNGKQVIVRVNDRGPFHEGRIIDLSYVAALKLGMVREGSAPVRIKTITAADVRDPGSRSQPVTAHASQQPTRVHSQPAASATQLYLQTGAFAQHHNARQMVAHLQRMHVDNVHITPQRQHGTTLYQVRVGPFTATAQRRATRRHLILNGVPAMPVR